MTNARAIQGLAKHYRMFIDGEWVDSKKEETIDVVNPATERVIASVPKANREQAKAALQAAEDSQPRWEDRLCTDYGKYGCDEAIEQYSSQHDRDGEADGGGRLSKRSCECCYREWIGGGG